MAWQDFTNHVFPVEWTVDEVRRWMEVKGVEETLTVQEHLDKKARNPERWHLCVWKQRGQDQEGGQRAISIISTDDGDVNWVNNQRDWHFMSEEDLAMGPFSWEKT